VPEVPGAQLQEPGEELVDAGADQAEQR
jgi:hypothetical protein